jgi:hypothetical protein
MPGALAPPAVTHPAPARPYSPVHTPSPPASSFLNRQYSVDESVNDGNPPQRSWNVGQGKTWGLGVESGEDKTPAGNSDFV